MASSSTHEHQLPPPFGTTTAPPPTPSTQPHDLPSTSHAADSFSRLLHRIPPTLSLSFPSTRRKSPPITTISPPSISLSDPKPTLQTALLSAAKQHGFFQLTGHSISSQLASSAESESLSIFNLSCEQKQQYFPKNWPVGFDDENDGDADEDVTGESLCLDSSCSTEKSAELELTSLREFTVQMEKVGLDVIQELACVVGFENPIGEHPSRLCSLMWISSGSGRFYPFAVGLHYQTRCQKYQLLSDSGWISVSPQVDSVLVTLGDIAQVWSNGDMKKVRGGRLASGLEEGNDSNNLSMTLLLTLALDSMVSPLLPKSTLPLIEAEDDDDEGFINKPIENDGQTSPVFNSFSFEDYAWRVYHMHQALLLKDPLFRYRV